MQHSEGLRGEISGHRQEQEQDACAGEEWLNVVCCWCTPEGEVRWWTFSYSTAMGFACPAGKSA